MTHRNIELQVALPKVTEVTRVQQQILQQQSNQQADFEQMIQKKTDRDLSRPDSADENRSVSSDNEKDHPSGEGRERKRDQDSRQEQEPPHPYKGKHIDLKG